jgi:leucyl-tRNA synthetase
MELVNELYAFCSRSECTLIGRDAAESAGTAGGVARPGTIAVVKEAVEALVLMIAPFAPHMAEELWEHLGHAGGIVAAGWPQYQDSVAKAAEVTVPVQVNGKVRGRITVPADATEEAIRAAALAEPNVAKHLEGKTVRKTVIAGGRLVSIVAG